MELTPHARRDLQQVPNSLYSRVRMKLLRLAENPRLSGCIKLTNSRNRYRIRVGDLRLLYSINDDNKVVTVHRIARRDKAY